MEPIIMKRQNVEVGSASRKIPRLNAEEIASEARQFFDSEKGPPRRQNFRAPYYERHSPRLGRNVGLYGSVRRDHWLWVEWNPAVIWFTERPTKFDLRVARQVVSCRFDMVLEWRDHTIECRRILEPKKTWTPERIKAEGEWCADKNFRYRTIAPEEVNDHSRLIEQLEKFFQADLTGSDGFEDHILQIVGESRGCTVDQLRNALRCRIDLPDFYCNLGRLLHSGRLISSNLGCQRLWDATVEVNRE